MELNPAQFKLLLAGPKVSRLMPFVTQRGYYADGCSTGSETLDVLRQSPVHVLLVELELDDMLLADLLQVVRRENLAGAVILLDDPAKSGLIVSQLIRGVDGYVATPPDEQYLFRIIERQLLAQWAVAQMSRGDADSAEKARLEKAVQNERSKVTELVKEIASLRGQLADARKGKSSGRFPMPPDTELGMERKHGGAAANAGTGEDGDDDGEAVTLRAARAVATQVRSGLRSDAALGDGAASENDRTSPVGFTPPPQLRVGGGGPGAMGGAMGGAKKPAGIAGFDEVPHTKPSQALVAEAIESESESETVGDDADLFLDLENDEFEDPTLGDQSTTQRPTKPIAAATENQRKKR